MRLFLGSNNNTVVEQYVSPFGPFQLRERSDRSHRAVQAQVRGLELLYNLASTSDVWTIEPSKFKPEWQRIVSTDGSPTVAIEPLWTVEQHLNVHNQHLYIELNGVFLCVLNDESTTCALVDGLISTVLLGEAGWPTSHTPRPLREKSRAASRRQRQALKKSLGWRGALFGLPFTALHLDMFTQMEQAVANGPARERLAVLAAYGRRLYVGFGLSIVEVQRHLTLLMDSIEPSQVELYLEGPEEHTDALFLEPLLNAWTEQGLSASLGDQQEAMAWTRIWN